MGSLFNAGNEVINALLDCSEDSYIKSLQDLVNHIVKPDKLYIYHTGDNELWRFANKSERETLDVEYAIPNKKVKFSEEVVNEVNFILKLVKKNMKLVPGGKQMRFLIAADPDGVGRSIRGGVDIGGKRRWSGEMKTKSEKGERKAQGRAIPTDKGNDDSKADKEQAVVLKGSAGEGAKDNKPAGRVDDQEGVGGQRKRKTRGRPKGKGKASMADKEQEVETIGEELEEVPIRGGVDIGGKRRRSGEMKTKSEKGERKAQDSVIPTDKGNDDSKADKEQAIVLKGSAGEGAKDNKPAGRVDDQEGVGGQRKRKTRGRPKGKGKAAMANKEQEVETIGAELEEVPIRGGVDIGGKRRRSGEMKTKSEKGERKAQGSAISTDKGNDDSKADKEQAVVLKGSTGEGAKHNKPAGGVDDQEGVGGKRKRKTRERPKGKWKVAMADKEQEVETIGAELEEVPVGMADKEQEVETIGAELEVPVGVRADDRGGENEEVEGKVVVTGADESDYAYDYVNLGDGSDDSELPTLIKRQKEKKKGLEKDREATFEERIEMKNFIMDRNLKSDLPENIKLIYEMPPWKQVNGGRSQQFTGTMSEQEKNWIGDIIDKLVYRRNWKFLPEERAFNEAIMNKLDNEGYLKHKLGYVAYGSLKRGEWLCAEVINSQGKLFSKRELSEKGNQSRFLIFDTMVYEMAHKALFTRDNHTIKDWPTYYSIHSDLDDDVNNSGSFGNREYLIFPVGNDSHFMLLIFNIREWELLVLDSLHPPDTKFQRQAAYLVITMVKSMLYLRDPTLLRPNKEVACYAPISGPKQQDCCSCGVFCILFMDAFTKGMNLSSLQWNSSFIEETRMRIAAELLKGELYDASYSCIHL